MALRSRSAAPGAASRQARIAFQASSSGLKTRAGFACFRRVSRSSSIAKMTSPSRKSAAALSWYAQLTPRMRRPAAVFDCEDHILEEMDLILPLPLRDRRLLFDHARTGGIPRENVGDGQIELRAPVTKPSSLIVCSVRTRPWVICSTPPVIASASLRLTAISVIDWIFVSRLPISA